VTGPLIPQLSGAPPGVVRINDALDYPVLVDTGDEDVNRVFGWYYGYPACCIEWFVDWTAENRRRDIEHMNAWLAEHPGWNDPIPPPPRHWPPRHPVSGHLLCPECERGPLAPLPDRPARHYGWGHWPDYDEHPYFQPPSDYESREEPPAS
jgi:hypothetical protein